MTHVFTHFPLELVVYMASVPTSAQAPAGARWTPLADIPGVGPRAQARFAELGMRTCADVLPWDREALQSRFGERGGAWLYAKVRGLDDRSVTPRPARKQVSRERTFSKDIADDRALKRKLDGVSRLVAADLRGAKLTARTVTVKLRDADFRTRTAARTLPDPFESDRVVVETARALFDGLRRTRRTAARLVGVALSGFDRDEGAQLGLFNRDAVNTVESERDRKLSRALDTVRSRFGSASLRVGEPAR